MGVFSYAKLTSQVSLKIEFQNVDQHAGVHGTKDRKDNQLRNLEIPCKYPS